MALGGLPLTLSDVLDEIQETGSYSLNSAKARWLADAAATGDFNASDFANKMSVKVVATSAGAGTSSPATFSGVDFGIAFTDRILVACVGLARNAEGTLDQTSCTIGGVSAVGGDSGHSSAGLGAAGCGVWAAVVPSGTSGNVVINWSGGTTAFPGLVLLSVSGISTSPHAETNDWNNTTGTSAGGSRTINIPSNGLLIAAVAKQNRNTASFTGVTKREEFNFGTQASMVVGFDNRMNSETGRSISVSWSGGTQWGGEARSYSQ